MIFDSGMMTHEESASLVEEWNFMLTHTWLVRASVEGLADTFIGRSFFGATAFLFGLDSLCLFRRKPFLVSISGRPLLLFHWAKPKMASFLRASSLEPTLSFLEFV